VGTGTSYTAIRLSSGCGMPSVELAVSTQKICDTSIFTSINSSRKARDISGSSSWYSAASAEPVAFSTSSSTTTGLANCPRTSREVAFRLG
jgi:hypothetical protein